MTVSSGKLAFQWDSDWANLPDTVHPGYTHGVWIGRRPEAVGTETPVLYVTDRGNHRVQVFDLQGNFIKGFYQDFPCSFAEGPEGEILIPDLHGFINIYDAADRPAAPKLGDNQHSIVEHHGWPNAPPGV